MDGCVEAVEAADAADAARTAKIITASVLSPLTILPEAYPSYGWEISQV